MSELKRATKFENAVFDVLKEVWYMSKNNGNKSVVLIKAYIRLIKLFNNKPESDSMDRLVELLKRGQR